MTRSPQVHSSESAGRPTGPDAPDDPDRGVRSFSRVAITRQTLSGSRPYEVGLHGVPTASDWTALPSRPRMFEWAWDRTSPAPEDAAPRLSVIAPCYNEEESLPSFIERMAKACEQAVGASYEIILINDGSKDRTWSCIQALVATRPGVVGVNLSRNHGHQLAVTAGLALAAGDRVLVIDADLQDPPELLTEMMQRMEEGFDVVYGRRRSRARESRFKLATAKLYYGLLAWLSEVDIPLDDPS